MYTCIQSVTMRCLLFTAKQTCLDTQFTCSISGNCIPYLWQCDGDPDCGISGEDEKDCEDRACRPDYIKCNKSRKSL